MAFEQFANQFTVLYLLVDLFWCGQTVPVSNSKDTLNSLKYPAYTLRRTSPVSSGTLHSTQPSHY